MSRTAVTTRSGRMEGELLRACERGDFSGAFQMISQGADPKSARDGGGWTPLHYACEKGNLSFVKTLVEKFNCDFECKSSSDHFYFGGYYDIPAGSTPLHMACRYVANALM